MTEEKKSSFEYDRPGIEFLGPLNTGPIILGGNRVPHIIGSETQYGTKASFVLDHRFGLTIPIEYAEDVMTFVAHAMAVAGGYSCFGEGSRPINPFSIRAMRIDEINGKEVSES